MTSEVFLLENRNMPKKLVRKHFRNIQNHDINILLVKNLTNFLFSMSASFLKQVTQCTEKSVSSGPSWWYECSSMLGHWTLLLHCFRGGDRDSIVCLFLGQLVDLSLYFRVAFFKQPENNLPQHTDPSADLRCVRNSF